MHGAPSKNLASNRVFVYGTLKPGFSNYQRFCAGRMAKATPAQVQGCLYQLNLGYPGLTDGDRWIQGTLLEFEVDALLAELDQLEGYVPQRSPDANEYTRELIETYDIYGQSLGSAWVYRMTPARIAHYRGRLMVGNEWPDAETEWGAPR